MPVSKRWRVHGYPLFPCAFAPPVSVLIPNRTPGFDEIYFLDDIQTHSSIDGSVQLLNCSFSAFCLLPFRSRFFEIKRSALRPHANEVARAPRQSEAATFDADPNAFRCSH